MLRELNVGKHKDKADSLEKKSDAKYYWDKIQQFSAKLNGSKRKTIAHIRLEKEIQSLEEEQQALTKRINELSSVSTGLPRQNIIVSTESVSDVSSIHTEELEETHNDISILERMREEARRDAEQERKAYENQKQEKIRAIQEKNEEIR